MINMDLTFITNLYLPIVMVICLCVGYVMKHWLKDMDNKLIPTILAVLGVILACLGAETITLEVVASGMVTGLASTGLHQVFKQLIESRKDV